MKALSESQNVEKSWKVINKVAVLYFKSKVLETQENLRDSIWYHIGRNYDFLFLQMKKKITISDVDIW